MKTGKIWLMIFVLVSFCAAVSFAGGKQEKGSGETSEAAAKQSMASEEGPAADTSTADGAAAGPEWLVEETDGHVTVIDSFGNTVTIDKPVTTFVSNGMGQIFAAARALDAEDMVAASSEYSSRNTIFFPRFSKMPSISTQTSVDNEMVLELGPSFIHASPFTLEQFSEAVRATIPIIQLNFNTLEDYRILGKVLGKETEAQAFVDWIKGYTDIIDERIASLSPEEYKDVFIYYGGQYGMSPPPPYGTFGSDNALRNDLIRRAGGRSMTETIPGEWITVDPEWVLQKDPPLIIRECYIISDTPEMGYSVDGYERVYTLLDNIAKQPAFEASKAVKTKQVHLIYGDIVTDSWFISLVYFAKWFHPELFADLDPDTMHQEYLTRFQGLDFDVRKQGVFAYSTE
jgi:iron complex transport system substrate-binding protein